ncbi:MAG: hypothetical protein LBM04_01510 [Opitutaceae bacterium]|jgi:hypothetical protein|nr:hypothetical protein [Opitutaceae bacterium]
MSIPIMGFPTKIQLIQRANNFQYYINFPAAIAKGMDFSKGEVIEWSIIDSTHLLLTRTVTTPGLAEVKKKILKR